MRKCIILLIAFMTCMAVEIVESQDTTKSKIIGELQYRQKEFYNQWKYLSDREAETAEILNKEIALYNEGPSVMALQQIETLKLKLIENLQDQIINDRSYVVYLERKLSELLNYEFTTLELQEDSDKLSTKSQPELEEHKTPLSKSNNENAISPPKEGPAETKRPSKFAEEPDEVNRSAQELMNKISEYRIRGDIRQKE